jgi:hypothetical protein
MKRLFPNFILLPMLAILAACTPRVEVAAPDKPIEINMNINIQHHIKVEIERDLEKAFDKNSDIF